MSHQAGLIPMDRDLFLEADVTDYRITPDILNVLSLKFRDGTFLELGWCQRSRAAKRRKVSHLSEGGGGGDSLCLHGNRDAAQSGKIIIKSFHISLRPEGKVLFHLFTSYAFVCV